MRSCILIFPISITEGHFAWIYLYVPLSLFQLLLIEDVQGKKTQGNSRRK